MRCIHIYRELPNWAVLKLHKMFSWFDTAKWYSNILIAPRIVLHVITHRSEMELQRNGMVNRGAPRLGKLPESLVTNTHIHTDYTTHTHTHAHTHTHTHRSLSDWQVSSVQWQVPVLFLHLIKMTVNSRLWWHLRWLIASGLYFS